MCGYPFEENGYTCRSVNGDLFGVLLSYKIERPVFGVFETDTELALNAISRTPLKLDDFSDEVADAKLEYLKIEKAGSLDRSSLLDVSAKELADIIRERFGHSYIYNLVPDDEHDVAKFSV